MAGFFDILFTGVLSLVLFFTYALVPLGLAYFLLQGRWLSPGFRRLSGWVLVFNVVFIIFLVLLKHA